ncbi:alpha/beta hydrolase [Flavobacterium sp. SOK18b]|uniref:alpha/beta hydrolase-fold protein n=1 Tax=Flavobacterium sp. SOK18b TaxID=797900 RepID=UPI0015FA5316|nr:alpha/beta hydrolase-fold protein [Flavobacterium sp. SOK18b]MBB1193256.1 alpha/beta hydrolase [Flavobacterium sp. SOK18b]
MKKTLLLLLFSVTVFSQKTSFTFDSQILGEKRELTISLPQSIEKNPNKKYPILILLDGDYLFDPFYGALQYGAYWDDLPETIIVGIHQNQKNERIDDCMHDDIEDELSGKGAQFFNFIGGELIPYLEKKYPTAPFRIIAGHDTTAGFLNYFLYKENPLFQAYISLAPELTKGMQERLPDELSKTKKSIFYYQANGDGDIRKIQNSIKNLDTGLQEVKNPLVHYKFDNFKNTSHYAVVLQAIPNALYHFFEYYKPISSLEFSEKIASLPSGYVDYLVARYDTLYENLGLRTLVRLNDFKAIEAAILKNKAYSELGQLAEIATVNYPKSMLSDYELGLMYEKLGDPKRAAKYYQTASQQEEIGDLTKTMMLEKYEDMTTQIPKK